MAAADDTGEHVVSDVVVEDGNVRGEAMLRGGRVVAVDAALENAVLLPGGARALLPFFRLDTCAGATVRSFNPPLGPYDVRIEVGEPRVVEVPAGRFEAIEVLISEYSGASTFLVRAALPHFILSFEYLDGRPGAELVGITPAL